jgi:hypothetical protein
MWTYCTATLDSVHLKIRTVGEEMNKEKKKEMRMNIERMKKSTHRKAKI